MQTSRVERRVAVDLQRRQSARLLRRRAQRPGIAEPAPVRVLPALVRQPIGEEQRQCAEACDARGGRGAHQRDVAKQLLARAARGGQEALFCQRVEQLREAGLLLGRHARDELLKRGGRTHVARAAGEETVADRPARRSTERPCRRRQRGPLAGHRSAGSLPPPPVSMGRSPVTGLQPALPCSPAASDNLSRLPGSDRISPQPAGRGVSRPPVPNPV